MENVKKERAFSVYKSCAYASFGVLPASSFAAYLSLHAYLFGIYETQYKQQGRNCGTDIGNLAAFKVQSLFQGRLRPRKRKTLR